MRDKASPAADSGNEGSKVGTDGEQPSGTDGSGSNIPIYIGNKLKALYEEVVSQPVPDHLLDLLKRLETGSGSD